MEAPEIKDPVRLRRQALAAFAIATTVNALLLGWLYRYYRVGYIDHLIAELDRPGIPDADVETALVERKDDSIGPLGAALAAPGNGVELRSRAAEVLGSTKDERALPYLAAALEDPDWRIRQAAAVGLSRMESRSSLETLDRALADPSASVRARAVASLGNYPPVWTVDRLEAASLDPEVAVRDQARIALEKALRTDLPADHPVRIRIEDILGKNREEPGPRSHGRRP
ncbi:MAG: HEAT repeat domain-containing protein [Planctomycetes bacterium]|nr:HEAT repeat domain-containing protein [Planctomycetota bacterium]